MVLAKHMSCLYLGSLISRSHSVDPHQMTQLWLVCNPLYSSPGLAHLAHKDAGIAKGVSLRIDQFFRQQHCPSSLLQQAVHAICLLPGISRPSSLAVALLFGRQCCLSAKQQSSHSRLCFCITSVVWAPMYSPGPTPQSASWLDNAADWHAGLHLYLLVPGHTL